MKKIVNNLKKFKFFKFIFIVVVLSVATSSHAFVYTLLSFAANAAARGQGNMCVKEGSKVGETITSAAGHSGLIKTISSSSPICANPALPTQAQVEFSFNFLPKVIIDLPEEFELKKLTDEQRYQGTILVASSKLSKNVGISIASRKRTKVTDPAGIANAVYQAQMKVLENSTFKNPEKKTVNGFDAWNIEVTGKMKGVFGRKIILYTTIIDSRDELLVIVQSAPEDEYIKYKSEFIALENKITGLEPFEKDKNFAQNQISEIKNIQQKLDENETNQEVRPQKNNTIFVESDKFLQSKIDPENEKKITANRRALVIGNDSYNTVSKLANAREDARTIASNLTAVGYQVTLKLDLNEKEMKSALRTFAAQVQGGDEVMFFFAGHGVQLGSANYLLPTDIVGDSEAQVRDEAIQLQRVLDDMSEKKAKLTLAMIDACRDNPFKSAGRAIGGRGLAPTTAATGQMVIFSAGTGQQALDRLSNSDKNKNGLFTRVFVQEMQKPNVSIDRVVKNVRNQVAELAKSVGHEQVPAIYDQVLGDFYFKK